MERNNLVSMEVVNTLITPKHFKKLENGDSFICDRWFASVCERSGYAKVVTTHTKQKTEKQKNKEIKPGPKEFKQRAKYVKPALTKKKKGK